MENPLGGYPPPETPLVAHRHAQEDSQAAYEKWTAAKKPSERRVAYANYQAALDREDKAFEDMRKSLWVGTEAED